MSPSWVREAAEGEEAEVGHERGTESRHGGWEGRGGGGKVAVRVRLPARGLIEMNWEGGKEP